MAACGTRFSAVALVVVVVVGVLGFAGGAAWADEGGSSVLPDGRQWELVSPPNKHGALIEDVREQGAVVQAAEDGSAVTYTANGAVGAEPVGNSNLSQVFSTRGAEGWSSRDIAPPHNAPARQPNGGQEYRLFSSDLSLGVVEELGDTPLAAGVTERTPYLRDTAAAGGFLPLLTAADVPSGTKIEEGAPHVVGASPDLRHVVLSSTVALTETLTAGGGLYEWTGGQLQLVSVLPEGKPESNARLGYIGDSYDFNVRDAISDDGSRVFWTSESGHLYMRDVTDGVTVQVDRAQGAPEPAVGGAQFQLASSDGSRVFFLDSQRLTADATEGGGLYVLDVDSGQLTDLTVDPNAGGMAGVQEDVIGVGEEGSSVYFVATGVLTGVANSGGERATAGANNLYVSRYDSQRGEWQAPLFIAALAGKDSLDWGEESGFPQLVHMTARVSPNGRYLAFMSDRSLTGYDNRDALSGEPDEEVFMYDAQENRIVCASCNPTGARPTGSARVPEWDNGGGFFPHYQPRYLVDTGRLFFETTDGLVPQDANGVGDVYEYEPQGVGSCGAAAGCVALISSGTSGLESTFLDASTSGDDVFFLTSAQLTAQDVDDSPDVYDAHVCSAAMPCFPAAPVPVPVCGTVESCRSVEGSPGGLGAPASALFSGAGNLVQSVPVAPRVTVKQKKKKTPKKKKKDKKKGGSRHGRARSVGGSRAGKVMTASGAPAGSGR
jgi:hypothetical protein